MNFRICPTKLIDGVVVFNLNESPMVVVVEGEGEEELESRREEEGISS